MNLTKNFPQFVLEFNRKDLKLLTSDEISEKFTIAFELEMECYDDNIKSFVHEQDLIDELRKKAYSLLKNEKIDFSNNVFFIEEVTSSVDFDDDDKTLDNTLNWEYYKDKNESIIVYYLNIIYQDIFERVDNERMKHSLEEEQLPYLIKKLKKHLPNFYRKYQDQLDCVLDMTLDKGIEVKPKTYIQGINNAIIFLNDFFNDFDQQDYWVFNEKTGLHINIGYKERGIKWNVVKGMFLLKDFSKNNTPFVFKNMSWRVDTSFTDSIFNQVEFNPILMDLSNINETEKYIRKTVNKTMKKLGAKHFGFNTTKLKKDKYIEFRYVGGVIDENLIVNKMIYFCYIVYSMISPEYKRKQYLKNLYKFVDELNV